MSTEDYSQPGAKLLGIAFGFATATIAAIYLSWDITQSHLNPVVTIAAFINGKVRADQAVSYVIAQALGSLLGVLLLWCVVSTSFDDACFGAPMLSPKMDVSLAQAFVTEMVNSFILVLVYCAAMDDNFIDKKSVPMAVGSVIFLVHLFSISTTGCGLNPFRSFAAALAASPIEGCGSTVWDDHWIYWVGPIVGGLIGAFKYKYVLRKANPLNGRSY
jgi:aquaporin PIP